MPEFKPFDIFRVSDNGQILWIESASAIEEAHAQVIQLGVKQPGGYLIFSHRTGQKIFENTGVPNV
jgi:hypothetical protein